MTHVLCLCPSRHVFADFQVNDSVPPQHALQIMRFVVSEILLKPETRHDCDKCGAPSDRWFCEVEGQEGPHEHDSEITIMGGVSLDA